MSVRTPELPDDRTAGIPANEPKRPRKALLSRQKQANAKAPDAARHESRSRLAACALLAARLPIR